MRLLFWESYSESAIPHPGMGMVYLPARRLDLTDLTRFGQEMTRVVGVRENDFTVQRRLAQPEFEEATLELPELAGMLPEQRGQVSLRTMAGPGAGPTSPIEFTLGDGLAVRAMLHGVPEGRAEQLLQRWNTLGRPRRTWALIYPALFLLGLACCVAPLVVLWARRDISLWLIVPTVGLLALAFTVCAPLIQAKVRQHRARHAGLDIDYRLLQAVRTDRAVGRRNLLSGLGGAVLGAAITLLGVWATLKAGG